MKLKAPPGVGDPCVAGVAIVARHGLYEVEVEIGALLVECFGFVEIETAERKATLAPVAAPAPKPRRSRPSAKKS